MAATSKKPWRNFRRKVADESDPEDNQNEQQDDDMVMEIEEEKNAFETIEKPVKKKKKKKDKKESSKLLSFEDDHDFDDGDVFKIKKSSQSKRLAKQLKKERLKEKEEILKAKEENSSSKDRPQKRSEEETDEKIRRLREEFMTLNGDDAAALDIDSEEEDKGTLHKLLGKGEIPDANLIHNIRKKRQQARDMGDFVPLDNAAKPENSSSRLVREDDNDKSEDEEEGRMDFSVNVEALERQRIKDQFLAAEHGSDEESDQEREWEAQQIKKGVTVGQPVESKTEDQMSDDGTGQSNGYTYQSTSSTTFKPFTAMSKTENLADINMDVIRKRLQERLDSMEEVSRRHTQERDTLVTDIDDADQNTVTCEGSVDTLEKRYCFFQEMRGYVRDLVECLNEKVPIINDLEARMLNMLRRRSEQLVSRRQQDVRDQCQDYMTSKAKIVMESSEGQAKQMRTAEREARRSRRRRKREVKNIRGHHEGLSSDDEENQSEITKFNSEKDVIDTGVERLFEDVENDFKEVSCVRERFESWKQEYGETYSDAYIGLCLPKLFNPFVRLQLIQWNPLEAHGQDFEDTQWFETLVFYGCQPEASELETNNDDIKLLPTITEKIIIPRITVLAETVWDPLSTTQTSRLVNTIQRIIRDYPCAHSSNRSMQNLLHAVVKRLQKTLDDDVFMPLYPKSAIENRSSGAAVFFHRQSWTCIKLLGSIMSWHGIISTSILQNLALDGLLNRYIILGLCNSVLNQETIQKCHSIVSTFPKEWFAGLNEEKTLPQLENLCKYMVSAARSMERELAMAKDMDKKEHRDMIKQINKMLVNVHALDHALSLQI
ncbi:PAX3- and PAX7-binding protein 1-like [Pecten maximus]|uniref:PAX3- and PAX7-binding protein 1-like n=1 Tax=Pecten maximus TaxID=6579 RepID=UPI001458E6D0|nr:PAX3- and PAX7-binding protein 1-like [Pecten maximus]